MSKAFLIASTRSVLNSGQCRRRRVLDRRTGLLQRKREAPAKGKNIELGLVHFQQ